MTAASRAARGADVMHQDVLQDCVAALDIAEGDVLELRDNADLIPGLLAGILLELRRRNAGHPVAAEDHTQAALCNAVLAGWGGDPFTCARLLEWSQDLMTTDRRAVLAACRALCGLRTDAGDLSAVRLGKAFRRAAIDTENQPLRLESAGSAKGSNLWQVRQARQARRRGLRG